MSSDEELEKLRQRRIAELQVQQAQRQDDRAQAEAVEAQKEALLRKILTLEARQRLTNVKMVRPDFAAQLELQLIQIAQSGRMPLPINDDVLKKLLAQIQTRQTKREITIRRI